MNKHTETIPDICEITTFSTASEKTVQLLIELPHGATKAKHFHNYEAQLSGSNYPEKLSHFFFVNTDVGSPELGMQIAKQFVEETKFGAVVIQSLIPRTFIDCNRVISLSKEEYKKGGVTPGIQPYVVDPTDIELLTENYAQYQKIVKKSYQTICQGGGFALMLHTYAPRTVGIDKIDAQIVDNLHRVYQPDLYQTWPIRPEIDFITTTLDNQRLAPSELIEQMSAKLKQANFEVAEGKSYPLHPSTTAFFHASTYPNQTLCIEIRRDLLVSEFKPFEQMDIATQKVERVCFPIANALSKWAINTGQSSGPSSQLQNIVE